MKKLNSIIAIIICNCLPLNAFSKIEKNFLMQTVIAPTCLFEKETIPHNELARAENLMLIQALSDDLEKFREKVPNKGCGSFLDLTPEWQNLIKKQTSKMSRILIEEIAQNILTSELKNLNQRKISSETNKESKETFKIIYTNQVNESLKLFNPQRMWQDLVRLNQFSDRSSTSANGEKAAQWFKTQAETLAKSAGRNDINVRLIATGGSYKQPSVVVSIAGQQSTAAGVLIGGHMDTLGNNKPGVDDDGTGSSTVLETLRVIIQSGMHFKRPMYFVWYAAEEQGLIGSKVVVNDFIAKKISLRGSLQLDMTGFESEKSNKIWLMDDYVDSDLSKFVGELGTTYAGVEIAHSTCGYACSDHANWNRNGFRAAMPHEADMNDSNPYIHTENDKLENISIEHMNKFAKISIAYMVELAEPVLPL